jgi:hypothetical protein
MVPSDPANQRLVIKIKALAVLNSNLVTLLLKERSDIA